MIGCGLMKVHFETYEKKKKKKNKAGVHDQCLPTFSFLLFSHKQKGDAINCLVHIKGLNGEESKFLVFEQRKYGFEGVSFAPVGGFVEPHEPPIQAAKREVMEETGYYSSDYVNLGSYRGMSLHVLLLSFVDNCQVYCDYACM
jgi:8-oxo-dGTP pyrophosphatase MutT (NUDIX family)